MVTLSRNGKAWPAALFVLIGTIYLSFLTKAYYWDGIDFAQTIESTTQLKSLVHPNHLIYNLVGYIFYRTLQAAGLSLRAVTALQILNSLLSAFTAVLLFQILKSVLRSTYYAVTLTFLFAFSATWWKYSTDANAYIPSIFFVLLSFFYVLPLRKSRPALLGLIYALSLCLHQMAIVFFPVLLVAIFVQDKTLTNQRRLINCLFFTVIAGALTLGAYVYSFYLLTGGTQAGNLLRWILSYSPDESFGFRPWINLGFTLRGHGRLFFGGRFNAISGLVNPFIVLLMIASAVLLLLLVVKVVRHFKRPDWKWFRTLQQDRLRSLIAKICVLWISVYLIVLYIFVAHHTYYRLFYLPALIILIGLILGTHQVSTGGAHKYRLAIFVALLTITNFLLVIFPMSHVEKYPPLAFAREMNQLWPRNTIIYYGSPNSDNSLVKYFSPGTNWKPLPPSVEEQLDLELRDARAKGINTWLETSAIDQLDADADGSAWLKQHVKPETFRILNTKAHNIRFIQVEPID